MSPISEIPELAAVAPSNVRSSPFFGSNRFKGLATHFINEISAITQESIPRIRSSKIAQLRALHSLKEFKKEHNLTIDPKYEISPWFTIGSLCAAGSTETALNATFFSVISDGLIDAALLAALVSLVNVLVGFFIGYILIRYSLHVERKHRMWTIPTSALASIVGVTFNFGLGSYREALQPEGTHPAFQQVIQSMLSQTLEGPPLDLKSFILVIFGLSIFFFSAYKGLKHNDPYPEYASRHLHYLEADEDLTIAEQDIRASVSDALRHFKDELRKVSDATEKASLSEEVEIPSPDQVQALLNWQSDLVSKMIAEAEHDAGKKFEEEQVIYDVKG